MGRRKEFVVELNAEEKAELQSIIKQGYHASRIIRRAQTLLWIDERKSDKEIANLHDVSLATVGNTRKKWVLEKTVEDKPRPGRPPILDGKQEAMLVALACSDAPDGVEDWTMQLLADRVVELGMVDSISDETIRLRLKKRDKTVAEENVVHSDSE
jgi:transposase